MTVATLIQSELIRMFFITYDNKVKNLKLIDILFLSRNCAKNTDKYS